MGRSRNIPYRCQSQYPGQHTGPELRCCARPGSDIESGLPFSGDQGWGLRDQNQSEFRILDRVYAQVHGILVVLDGAIGTTSLQWIVYPRRDVVSLTFFLETAWTLHLQLLLLGHSVPWEPLR